ncbi:MAG: adenylyltransferase/cytidyltransferase family protein [Clostridiaceae bacterium]|nr:adenylyltransferase/cytidyltransferase family protein [Clostridiaceae bacterium]
MKDYKIGYIAGVFDLFHIGHLNLIRKAKDKCEYLIVGVLTDELVVHFKGKPPYIPFDERLEIVGSIKYVDKAVPVTLDNIDKMAAWELYKFDCLFSGDDYVNNESWIVDKKRLNQVGSDIYFFPYTKSTSSTQIKKALGRG